MTDPAAPASRAGKAARNETRKAFATTANALSIAIVITVWLQPMLSGRAAGLTGPLVIAAFVALQSLAHYVLR